VVVDFDRVVPQDGRVQLDASARRLLAMFVISSVLAVRALPAAAVDDDSADEEHARTTS